MISSRSRQVVGWIAVGCSTLVASVWAFWGIIENFHEGWYCESLGQNLGLMFGQYLGFPLAFVAVALLAIARPRWGFWAHVLIAVLLVIFLRPLYRTTITLLSGPLLILGTLYWLGRPLPQKWAYALVVGLPVLTLLASGAEPAWRVLGRFNDGDLQARVIQGNGVTLIWAPEGPGWPRDGVSWQQALKSCSYLAEDGKTLASTPQIIWRLPTVDEAVRSMVRHGKNSGGVWNPRTAHPWYWITPDKESPLWNVHSGVIYWWTSTEVDSERAYIVVYNGRVYPRKKQVRRGYLGFRAVKTLQQAAAAKQRAARSRFALVK
ncbi:MAG TPA: DUF1566 domain-containing protein [Acidobacteriota bacterium]|nr:DUF1566 domain-containing protein [Acidobacteriota bacterium]